MAVAVAGELVADPPRVLALARANLAQAQQVHRRGQAYWLHRWEVLLDGPLERVLEALTSPAPWARETRQNSPFSGVLTAVRREQVLGAFQDAERSGISAGDRHPDGAAGKDDRAGARVSG